MAARAGGSGGNDPPDRPNANPTPSHVIEQNDILDAFRDITWSNDGTQTCEQALDAYVQQWHTVLTRTRTADLPPRRILVAIMLTAIRPLTLRYSVQTAITTGRGPDGSTAAWRMTAANDLRRTIDVIREYARREDSMPHRRARTQTQTNASMQTERIDDTAHHGDISNHTSSDEETACYHSITPTFLPIPQTTRTATTP